MGDGLNIFFNGYDKIIQGKFFRRKYLVPRLARAVTWPVPAPVAQGHHGLLHTTTCPIRGLRDAAMMKME